MPGKAAQDRELTAAEKARAARLRAARQATKLGQAEFCRQHELTYDTYRSHERGRRPLTQDAAKRYAKALKIDWRELYGLEDGMAEAPVPFLHSNATGKRPAVLEAGQPRDLPVLGRAVGGEDGWFEFNGEVLDVLFRPPLLDGVRSAYAVFVSGSSMEPRYMDGETIFVNPARPAKAGDFVVAQIRPQREGEPIRGIVKQLKAKSAGKIVLQSLNPPGAKSLQFAADQIISLHRIVLAGDS